jgi:hypothetical protein
MDAMADMDSDDENWYDDYIRRHGTTTTTTTAHTPSEIFSAPFPLPPPRLATGQVIDAKNTAGSIMERPANTESNETNDHATGTHGPPVETFYKRIHGGGEDHESRIPTEDPITNPALSSSALATTAIGVKGNPTTNLNQGAPHQQQPYKARRDSSARAIAVSPPVHPSLDSQATSVVTANTAASASHNSSSGTDAIHRSNPQPPPLTAFVRTTTVEAFAVPSNHHHGNVVMAYPAANNATCNRGTVVTLVVVIVLVLAGSGYCASGACQRPSDNSVSSNGGSSIQPPSSAAMIPNVPKPADTTTPTTTPTTPTVVSAKSSSSVPSALISTFNPTISPTDTLEPSRTRTNREVAVATFLSNRTLTQYNQLGHLDRPEDQAVQWLAHNDPLQLWPNDTSSQWRLLQRYSLLTLYFQQWTVSSSSSSSAMLDTQLLWRTEWYIVSDECTWSGITCAPYPRDGNASTTDSKVREILLDSSNLHGTLSADLGLLTELVRFSIYNNSISGTLPVSIGLWTNLEFFRTANNSFTGTVPNAIGAWTSLYFASFNANDFRGTMPGIICSFPNLTYLVADCGTEIYCPCCHLCLETIDLGH